MDDVTQGILERAKQRREALAKMMADTPINKRLAEEGQNDFGSQSKFNEVSPNKRQCLKDLDNDLNSGSTTINLNNVINFKMPCLSSEISAGDEESKIRSQSTDRTLTSTRKNRFAALAEKYNTWEDESNVHFKPETKSPVRKEISTKVQKSTPTKNTFAHSSCESLEKSPLKLVSTSNGGVNKLFPSPTVDVEVATKRSVSKESVREIPSTSGSSSQDNSSTKSVSSITVFIGDAAKEAKTVERSEIVHKASIVSRKVVAISNQTSQNSPSKGQQSKTVVAGRPADIVSQDKSLNESMSDEPTKKPVSERLAAWQTKVTTNESGSSPVSARIKTFEKKVAKKSPQVDQGKTGGPRMTTRSGPVKVEQQSSVKSPSSNSNSTPRRSSSKRLGKSDSPLSVPPASASPKKLQPATQILQNKLQDFCTSRTNELVERSKQSRATELAQLENRWKNGIPKEEGDQIPEEERAQTLPNEEFVPSSAIPAPPSPPPTLVATATKNLSIKKSVKVGSDPKSPASAKSGKREEAKNKLRSDFESKLRMMGFDVDGNSAEMSREVPAASARQQLSGSAQKHVNAANVETVQTKQSVATVTVSNNASKSVSKVVAATVQSNNRENKSPVKEESKVAPSSTPARIGSIYSLIKKPTGDSVSATPSASATKPIAASVSTTPAYERAEIQTPVSRHDLRQKFQDSFDSESDFLDETDDFRRPYDLHGNATRPGVTFGHTSVKEYVPTTESESMDSESALSSSEIVETEDDTTQGDTTTEDDCGDNKDGGMSSDQLSSDESDSNGNFDLDVSELLDDEELEAVVKPSSEEKFESKQSQSQMPVKAEKKPEREESSSSAEVVLRRPAKRRSTDESIKEPRGYISLQEYRQQTRPKSQPPENRSTRQALANKRATAAVETSHRQQEQVYGNPWDPSNPYFGGSTQPEQASQSKRLYPTLPVDEVAPRRGRSRDVQPRLDKLSSQPEKSVEQKVQELKDMISQEMSVIQQTSNALNQCCHAQSTFAGSAEAVECHRLLLMACKKRETYMIELQRLRSGQSQNASGPYGRLTISDIRLPIKSEFLSRIGTSQDLSVHHFLIMIRHGAHVVFTQMVSTHESVGRGSLDFPNLINLNKINQNFVVDLEIYGMSVTRDPEMCSPRKKKKGLTPKKMTPKSGRRLESPGGPMAVRTTNFVHISSLQINMAHLMKTTFALDRVPYLCPLQGSIQLRLKCLMENSVEEKGFLTMFEDVSGLGAWHRRWCSLKNGQLSYWKYPDEEKEKEPMGVIELKSCVTEEVGLVSRDVCARPNTFEIRTVRKQQRGERETLVTKCYETMSTTKHWISADTKEDRELWCSRLNEALVNLRAWNPDAMRPIKRPTAAPREGGK